MESRQNTYRSELLALPAYYAEQGLCNGTASVYPYVRPSVRPVAAAEEQLWHSPVAGNRAAVARGQQLGAQQQINQSIKVFVVS